MRGSVLALLTALLASRATAEDSTVDEARIRAELVSKVPVEVAWGLHHAVEARLPNVDDLVRRVLGEWAGEGDGARELRTAAIDAVIELDVWLPDDLLREAAVDTGTPRRLLLAARKPTACRDLLRALLVADVESDAWIAACNLLAPQHDAELVRHLLSVLRLEARITVRDPGKEETLVRYGRSIGGGVACGRVGRSVRVGWPPRFRWQLLSTARSEARLVAEGRTSIYAVRRRIETGDFVCSTIRSDWTRARRAQEHLADLLRMDVDEFRSSLSTYETVGFTDLEAWDRRIAAAKEILIRAWSGLLARCRAAGLLTIEQASALPPRIVFDVHDERSTKEPPLPIP